MAGRLFELHRNTDVSGVSGTGVVADGVEFDDDTVVLHWRGAHPSTVVWPGPSGMSHVMAVHGHNGATAVLWAEDL